MNIKRSIRVALAERDKNMAWLTDQLGVSRARTSMIANAEVLNSKNIVRLANIFGLPVSEFIALGEREPTFPAWSIEIVDPDKIKQGEK